MIKKSMRYASHRSLVPLVLSLFALGAVACAPKVDDDLRSELARLRQEHQELLQELARLRAQLADSGTIPAAVEPRDRRIAIDQPAAPAPAPATTTLPPGSAITQVLNDYSRALEAEDYDYLRDEIYGGDLPEKDSEFLKVLLDRTEELEVEIEPQTIQVDDGKARAEVKQTMTFRLSRTYERRRLRLAALMHFEHGPGGWLLRSIQLR